MNALILTGGISQRMGRDKALIERPDGKRQIDHMIDLARRFADHVFLSTRDDNDRGTGVPLLVDEIPGSGPTAALAAAAATGLHGPWLVLGCDLLLLDTHTLDHLIANRDSSRAATAFRNRLDGRAEPLCAIYEASGIQSVHGASHCARKFLESLDPLLLDLPQPAALDNVNTPADLAEAFLKLERGVAPKAVSLLYFAILREARGLSAESVETLAWTAAGLYEEISFRHRLPLESHQLRVARNGEFSSWDAPVSNGDEFVFIPPVAGG
ncbi:MAG: NTP transferase domain-containing protein [Luteolibacter sp.]